MCDIETSQRDINNFIDSKFIDKDRNRVSIVMIGGPGSGKSTGKERILNKLGLNFNTMVNIDPDEILYTLFNNNNDCRIKVDEINDILYELTVAREYNLIFDGTGKNFSWYTTNIINYLKDHNYKVYLFTTDL